MIKRLIILGGGESGYGSAVLGKAKGFQVFISDSGTIAGKYRQKLTLHGIDFEEGGHTEEKILAADIVVKSPGIPDTVPLVVKLRAHGIPVVSEIEFAGKYTKGKTICITGSNGKTTTATLTYGILKQAGYDVALAGNIGDSFAYRVATDDCQWYVLELSSFQLDGMYDFRADIAVLLNISPDHLDRYGYCFDNYADSKMRIVDNMGAGGSFIYFSNDVNITDRLGKVPEGIRLSEFGSGGTEVSGTVSSTDIILRSRGQAFRIPLSCVQIPGIHNIYNITAASLAALEAGVSSDVIIRTVSSFGGVRHRLEKVGEIGGVEFINDSKATNTDAAWYALDGMKKPVVWIAGGTDKGNDYEKLKNVAAGRVKALICMGADNSKLIKSFSGIIPVIVDTGSLEQTMSAAVEYAVPGDVVLLSPACASFDLFRNYEDRGDRFREWVKKYNDNKKS